WLSINDKGEVCEMIGIEACLKQDEIDDYNLQDVSDNHNPRYKLEGEIETSIVYLAIETKEYRTFIAELYQFTSNGRTFDLDIVFEDHKVDLKVEGILFQPLEKVEHDQVLQDEELSNDSLQCTMKKDLGTKLLKWFHVDKGQEGSAVDNNGRKSLMFSARGLIRSHMSFQSSSESRFFF
ncbi:hypothetical protein Tco_1397939, partial [Tanacetum coccineum]